jgi:hypothetical protein
MSDPINHPAHYTFGGVEVIDALEAWNLPFHLANVVKYVARAGRKDPARIVEDLRKARWYLDRYIAQVERDQRTVVVEAVKSELLRHVTHTGVDLDALAQFAARESAPSDLLAMSAVPFPTTVMATAEPTATDDAYWQRHPLGSPERVQAVEEHRAAVEASK